MSLVEQALRRMRQTGQAPAAVGSAATGPAFRRTFARIVEVPPGSDTPHDPTRRSRNRVVSIDQAALRHAGLLPPDHQQRQIAQQYRQIKRPLIASAFGSATSDALPNGQLIMMASAMPGEGKTFTSINLAFSLTAERDLDVLLVDADVAKPHISSLFGLDQEPGLLDVLRDRTIDVEDLILPTDVNGLYVLPAGSQSSEATELLASERMAELTARIGGHGRRRIVLFDSPPLLLTTESQVLAHAVGQVVLVVRADSTMRMDIENALSYLAGCQAVSLLLNQSVSVGRSAYYYYGYGYGHADGQHDSSHDPAAGRQF